MTLLPLNFYNYNKILSFNYCKENSFISYFNSVFFFLNNNDIIFFTTKFSRLITKYLRRFLLTDTFVYTKFLRIIFLVYNIFNLLITKFQLKESKKKLFLQNFFLIKKPKTVFKKYPSIKSIYVNINIVPNNIFCNFSSVSGSKTFRFKTAGVLKIKISKKRLFYAVQLILESFFKELNSWRKKYLVANAISFINLKMPKYIIRYTLKKFLRAYPYLLSVDYSIPFNGCKAKKRRRKKRLSYRNFK